MPVRARFAVSFLRLAAAERNRTLGNPWSVSVALVLNEADRFRQRGPARTDVLHRGILVPDRHAAEEHQLVRGQHDLRNSLADLRPRHLRTAVQFFPAK